MAETIQEFILGLTFGKADEKNLALATKDAEDAAKKVDHAWSGVGKAIATGIAAIGAAAIGAGAGLFALADKSTAAADAIAKGARNAGIATDEYQKLAHAAGLSDVPIETLGRSIQDLNRQLLEASTGGAEPFVAALRHVGLSADDLGGTPTENLGKIFDALNAIPDEAKRSALSIELLGRGGRQMASLIAEGSAGLAELSAEAERLGLVIDEAGLAASESFQDSLENLQGTVTALGRDLGITLAPAIENVVDDLTEWAAANGEVLRDDLAGTVDDLGGALTELLPLIDLAVSGLGLMAEAVQGLSLVVSTVGHTIDVIKENPFGFDPTEEGFDRAVAEQLEDDQTKFANRERRQGERAAERAAKQTLADQERLRLTGPLERSRIRAARETLKGQVALQEAFGKKKPGRGGGKRKAKPVDLEAEDFELLEAEDALGAELDDLTTRAGATPEQRQEALVAASRSLAGYASVDVARKAAVSRLSSLTGVDLSPSKDPILSEIFGENVPDANLSMLAMGATPNTLIATINNNFDVDVTNQINGAGNPAEVGAQVTATVRAVLTDEVAKVTKLYKPPFRR